MNIKSITAFAQSARKALVSAVGVAATIVTLDGVPASVKAAAAAVLAVAAAFGVTYATSNKPAA